jgi:hypothetical protein
MMLRVQGVFNSEFEAYSKQSGAAYPDIIFFTGVKTCPNIPTINNGKKPQSESSREDLWSPSTGRRRRGSS